MNGFDNLHHFSQAGVTKMTESFGAWTKGLQALAVEMTESSKKAFEANTAFVQKLISAKTLDSAIEVQSSFAKQSYETFVAQTTKMNELVVDIAKDTAKPFEIVKP